MTGAPHWNDATRAQITAARPDASTWLSANAGSGKTRVLTDRVARLLLDRVNPQHILCLTYTKAAASEMQNRLFKRLGAWAMLDDDALRAELSDLGVLSDITPEKLKHARTLFAQAIETPGGLKIQTIHSFCASLLRRFPLEARVSPQFTEIEDRAADLLQAEIVDRMADGKDARLVKDLARFYTGEDFGKLTRAIVGHRQGFDAPITETQMLGLFDLPADTSSTSIADKVFLGEEATLLNELIPHLLAKGGNDEKAGLKLQSISNLDLDALPMLENVLLTGSGANEPFTAKIGSFPTKGTRDSISAALPALNDLMARVETARETRLAFGAAIRSLALHNFAHRFTAIYAAEKEMRGWLDFDDLILRARALLTDKQVAAWVLYRIDGGIDHILVDEAQDTSPRQWDVIERLADEFSAGVGSREGEDRTLFVVGDKKQSIYSFQGADPLEFDRKKARFQEKLEGAGLAFQSRSLEYSFRSSSAILRTVDQTFDPAINPGFGDKATHLAFKDALPGRVDLWPLIEPVSDEDDQHWSEPLDRRSAQHHTVVLAEQIAAKIKQLIESENHIPDEGPSGSLVRRRIRAGDFLILVQRRSALFSEIIRACKAAALPIAGADRLKVGAELAVRDLAALLSFLATPEDSLSLATALRSPLFGWSEKQIYALAHDRTEDHLWQTLRNKTDTYPETLTILRDLRAQVDFLRPYDLIERVLGVHDGRRRLLARLGPEAEDGIDALLEQALAYERNAVPSLTGFLVWMETDDLEIKRQIDSASDQIRVMTVHGAKGLEAPIVILPDTGQRNAPVADDIINLKEVPVWRPLADAMPQALASQIADYREAQYAERMRLLYVAMTRAEKWLIVAAAGALGKKGDSWYQMVEQAMSQLDAVVVPEPVVAPVRYSEHDWDQLPIQEARRESTILPKLEPHFSQRIRQPDPRTDTLSPSDMGGDKVVFGDDGMAEDIAKEYGNLVHRLLEHLADQDLADAGNLLAAVCDGYPAELVELAKAEVRVILAAPHLAEVFQGSGLSEVAISATIGDRRIHGSIDRLVITDDAVLAVDFKSNRTVPATADDCPEGLKRQLGAYAHALREIYPNREIRTAILWTRTAELMVLPHDIVTTALMRSPYLDAPTGGS